jgi:hypothetical protein
MNDDRMPSPYDRIPPHACLCGHAWDDHTQVMMREDVAYECEVEWPQGKAIGQQRYCNCTEYRPDATTPLELPWS